MDSVRKMESRRLNIFVPVGISAGIQCKGVMLHQVNVIMPVESGVLMKEKHL